MGKNKLKHFAEVLTFPNIFQLTKEMKGKWDELFFKNGNPITLELACGRGEYTLGLGEQYPDRNFIGVDIKGARLWRGGKTALEKEMKNVAFLRTQIDHLFDYFEPGEVKEIWITFPDPYPEKRNIKRRLTSPKYLEVYKQVLQPGGILHLKTDDTNLYQFTLEVLAEQKIDILHHTDDLYSSPLPDPILLLKTYYEKIHLAGGKTIKYVKFKF
jgi:tRNA (guanine-N7-)-methyltransferase